MKILLVSSLRRKLGSDITASRARMVFNLAKGLINRGHSVSILAPANSIVEGAIIIPVVPKSFVELPPFENQFYAETAYLVTLARIIQERSGKFDIVHNHTYPEYINLLIEDTLPVAMITTLHTPVTPELIKVLKKFPKAQVVAQTETYRNLASNVFIPHVVYSGIDTNLFEYSEETRDYLLWIGRLGKGKNTEGNFIDGKGVKDAINVAVQTGEKLLLLGNVEDKQLYEKEVYPYLSKKIQWISPISFEQTHSQDEICKLMQGAKALIITTKFEEAFGLIAAEAMACGTPVIGFARGSVPEVVEDRQTGFVINPSEEDKRGDFTIPESGIAGHTKAVEKIYSMKDIDYKKMQKACRERVEKYFTIDKMVSDYEKLYSKLVKKNNLS